MGEVRKHGPYGPSIRLLVRQGPMQQVDDLTLTPERHVNCRGSSVELTRVSKWFRMIISMVLVRWELKATGL